MKNILLRSALALSVVILVTNCNDSTSNKTVAADTLTQEGPPKPLDTNMNKPAAVMNEFVNKAAPGGIMEVELGKLAQTNGDNPDVKDYGKMLEADHSTANATLQGIASAENINMPSAMTDEQTTHLKDMEKRKGADFDKHFISMMVDDHNKDIGEFKKAASGNENEKVKDFAAKTLPILQKHLDRAKAIRSKMK